MVPIEDAAKDLKFIRQAVEQREKKIAAPRGFYYMWALYILVGYSLIDLAPRWSGWWFLLAWFPAGAITGYFKRRYAMLAGEQDRERDRRARLHFIAGGSLAVAASLALPYAIPGLSAQVAGQLCVVLFGLLYFLAGVHFDSNFLWLGPVLMVGGICVGLVPSHGWSLLGLVIAAGLVVPTFFKKND